MYLPPPLRALDIEQIRRYVTAHAVLSNRVSIPFISTTIDFARALYIAFYTYKECTKVAILLICPWKLKPGSHIACKDLRARCGLEFKLIYNTEVLIWARVPSAAIVYQWDREQICRSGLFDVFLCLAELITTMRLKDLREKLETDYPHFSSRKIAHALVYLGMSPSEFRTKQVFLFFLGLAVRHTVEKSLSKIEAYLLTGRGVQIADFEDAIF